MDDLDSLLQDLQRPAPDHSDSTTVALNDLDDLMSDLQKPSAPVSAPKKDAQAELDDLLSDLATGPSKPAAPAPAAAPKPAPIVSKPVAVSSELDDLLNDLDAPPPRAKAQPPQQQQQQQTQPAPRPAATVAPPAPKPAPVKIDDLDDLLDGLDAPVATTHAQSKPAPSGGRGGGGGADDLFNEISSSARSAGGGGGRASTAGLAPVRGESSGPSRGLCAGCNQGVHGEVLQSMGRLWHPEHFCCANCQQNLGCQPFFEYEGQPHCEKCYRGLFCPRCAKCDKSITDRIITALGKKWHPDCFTCSTCNTPFAGGSFFERDGFPYCREHFYNNSISVCGMCEKPVTGECVNAMNKAFHPDCFVCAFCRKAFVDGSFFESGGKPYCKLHYHAQTGSVCGGCQKAITGRSVNAMGKNWHPEHFVCAFCVNPLGGGNYTEKQGKPYCKECFSNLFG